MFSIGIYVPKGTNVEKIKSTFDSIGWGERVDFGVSTYGSCTDYCEIHFNHATEAGLAIHEELKKKNKFIDFDDVHSWEVCYTKTMEEYRALYKKK
jgi:hypothetical protein